MSRFSMCPMSAVVGSNVCPELQGEDAARLLRFLVTPVKVLLLALLLGIALALSMQWAQPFSLNVGGGGAGHFTVQPATGSAADQSLQERVDAFLVQFEVRSAHPQAGGGPQRPHPIP